MYRVAVAAAFVALVVVLFLAVASSLWGPVPEMSLVPNLPDDVEIVTNETEYTDMGGGVSARVMVLRSSNRSSNRSPADVTRAVSAALDADPGWRKLSDGEWLGRCVDGGEQTRASVEVEQPGDVDVAHSQTVHVDTMSAVFRLDRSLHNFGACPR